MKLFVLFFLLFPLCIFAKEISTPHILSDEDAQFYKKAFEFQQDGKFKESDKSLAKVENSILKGSVLFERYLSDSYQSKSSELKKWLFLYSDYAGANRIYKLARNKGGKNLKTPTAPKRTSHIHSSRSRYASMIRNTYSSSYVNNQIKKFKKTIYKGHSKNAKSVLNETKFKKAIRQTDYDRMCGTLAFMYYLDNMYEKAEFWAKKPAERNSSKALWVLGLINYSKENYQEAGELFERYAKLQTEPRWQNATGAFWAARAYENSGDSQKKDEMLTYASTIPNSFYGMLARKQLNLIKEIEWSPFRMTSDDAQEILSWKGGLRTLALIQIGELEKSEAELKHLLKHDKSIELIRASLALAGQENLPNFSMDTARRFIDKSVDPDLYSSASYPIPSWEPQSGWSVDQALVFAVVRQESRFKPNAKSWVGASGLMQVMPTTASFIAKDSSLKSSNKRRLFQPEYNMDLGQKYISFLNRILGGETDLIRILSAYNAGPKTVLDFDKKVSKHHNDPLLYLESFPAKETRTYVKNVLMNLWMYRGRFEETPQSLTNLADGNWPRYSTEKIAKRIDENDTL
ncbi:MAG: transglycosylase SLT domain-containing protein [Alphaproteobacteria bacterium]